MPCVDASVVVSLFVNHDPGHEAARAWLARSLGRGDRLIAPVILIGEVGAAVRRQTGNVSIAAMAVRAVEDIPGLELIEVSGRLASRSAEIALEQGVRGCDAIYLAAAEAEQTPLVTFDTEQLLRGAAVTHVVRPE